MEPSRDEIWKALESVIDPELRRPVTDLDMVREVEIAGGDVLRPAAELDGDAEGRHVPGAAGDRLHGWQWQHEPAVDEAVARVVEAGDAKPPSLDSDRVTDLDVELSCAGVAEQRLGPARP